MEGSITNQRELYKGSIQALAEHYRGRMGSNYGPIRSVYFTVGCPDTIQASARCFARELERSYAVSHVQVRDERLRSVVSFKEE